MMNIDVKKNGTSAVNDTAATKQPEQQQIQPKKTQQKTTTKKENKYKLTQLTATKLVHLNSNFISYTRSIGKPWCFLLPYHLLADN